jgi:hypothetical protein
MSTGPADAGGGGAAPFCFAEVFSGGADTCPATQAYCLEWFDEFADPNEVNCTTNADCAGMAPPGCCGSWGGLGQCVAM